MEQIDGVWWTINQKQVPGRLTITDENKISLTTYEKLYDTGIINGFAKGKKITLVDIMLDRTDVYYKPEEKEEYEGITIEKNEKVEYYTYTYIVRIAILGHNYKRKGDIRLKNLQLKYTNLDKWVNWKTQTPIVKNTKQNITVKLNKFPEKIIKLDRFDIVIRKPYFLIQKEYDMQINNEVVISIENIQNQYIQSLQEIIKCIQSFLVLCTGDNINVTNINASDFYDRNIEIILGYDRSNYENRTIFKNIIKYENIENNLENILKNWIKIYMNNELLIANFVNLQRREELLISEYTNLMSAIDNLYLVITKQKATQEHFANIVKRLLREINFILDLSDEQIDKIAIKVKDIRRYFVHSNKTQRDMVNSNISFIRNIMTLLIEVIRVRIMIEIDIDKEAIEKYYKSIEEFKSVKFDIVNNVNNDEEINDERIREGKKIMRPLSKKDRDDIAELNAIMGTKYRESGYDLENSNDLIKAIENTTAEYMDYTHYWGQIENVMENFDQSLEVYYPEKWFRTVKEGGTGSELIDETIASLYDASDNLYKLSSEAEKRCIEMWKFLLLGDNNKAKEHFLGDISKYTEKQLLDALEETTENIFDVQYENKVQNDTRNFAEEIREYLEEIDKIEE